MPALYPDLQEQYRHWHNIQSVTLTTRRASVTTTDTITHGRIADRDSIRQAFGAIELAGDETGWLVPKKLVVNATSVRPGDTITKGSDVWTINRVTEDLHATRYLCTALKQV